MAAVRNDPVPALVVAIAFVAPITSLGVAGVSPVQLVTPTRFVVALLGGVAIAAVLGLRLRDAGELLGHRGGGQRPRPGPGSDRLNVLPWAFVAMAAAMVLVEFRVLLNEAETSLRFMDATVGVSLCLYVASVSKLLVLRAASGSPIEPQP